MNLVLHVRSFLRLWLQLHWTIYRPDSFTLIQRYCANLKAVRYESTNFNIILVDESHRVIVAYSRRKNACRHKKDKTIYSDAVQITRIKKKPIDHCDTYVLYSIYFQSRSLGHNDFLCCRPHRHNWHRRH